MKTQTSPFNRARPLKVAALAVCAALTISAWEIAYGADTRFQPVQPVPGGLSGTADITSYVLINGQLRINWDGFGGPYVLERRPTASSGLWESVGNSPDATSFLVPATNRSSIYRVRSPLPQYTSADTCIDCHSDTHSQWSQTIHAGALDTLKAIGQDKNAACLKCHTVGFGFATGFKDLTATPYFAGVQCENCHGPAAQHASAPENLELRPKITYSAKLCGGCHNDFHHPTYEEWSTALHSKVDPHVQAYFLDPNPVNSVARMNSCGACHSGAVRLQMLKGVPTGTVQLPSGQEAAKTPITCQVCHDSHKPNTDGTHALRNPRFSTNFFSYNTSTNTSFAKQYKETTQICGQCHNQRGASYKDTSRPPHHSPQYNLLIGDIGMADGNVPVTMQSAHTQLQQQCTHCHTHGHSPAVPTEEEPVYTGHNFEPSTEACVTCHQSKENAEAQIAKTQAEIKNRIQEVKALLNQWGETKAPGVLRTKYGKLAWEYNSAGQISNPTGSTSIVGPTSAEQADVSADIKKARMWLYMVEHDGSYGVHNAKYARYLLGSARTNVLNLLNAP